MTLTPIKERFSKMFWVVEDRRVRHLRCYECPPNDDTVWWCPEAGFSGSTAHHFFQTQQEAELKFREKLRKQIEAAEKLANELRGLL